MSGMKDGPFPSPEAALHFKALRLRHPDGLIPTGMNTITQRLGLWALAIFAVAMSSHGATLVGYWDFNSGSLARSQGTSGSMSTFLVSATVAEFQSFSLPGTTANAQPGVPDGASLSFISLLNIVEDGTITISGLNFSGLEGVNFSFAFASNVIGLDVQSFSLEYNVGSGWQTFSSISEPTNSFTTRTFDLSSVTALNGASSAALRIHFVEALNVVDILSFDNITVTAVPEPGTIGLLASGAALLALRRRPRCS